MRAGGSRVRARLPREGLQAARESARRRATAASRDRTLAWEDPADDARRPGPRGVTSIDARQVGVGCFKCCAHGCAQDRGSGGLAAQEFKREETD